MSLAECGLSSYGSGGAWGGLLTRLTGDIQMLRQMLVNAVIACAQNVLLIVAMNPNLQGLGDIMGRTLVVRPRRYGAMTDLQDSADGPRDDDNQPDA